MAANFALQSTFTEWNRLEKYISRLGKLPIKNKPLKNTKILSTINLKFVKKKFRIRKVFKIFKKNMKNLFQTFINNIE